MLQCKRNRSGRPPARASGPPGRAPAEESLFDLGCVGRFGIPALAQRRPGGVPDQFHGAQLRCPAWFALRIAKVESNFNPRARGAAGELGVFQMSARRRVAWATPAPAPACSIGHQCALRPQAPVAGPEVFRRQPAPRGLEAQWRPWPQDRRARLRQQGVLIETGTAGSWLAVLRIQPEMHHVHLGVAGQRKTPTFARAAKSHTFENSFATRHCRPGSWHPTHHGPAPRRHDPPWPRRLRGRGPLPNDPLRSSSRAPLRLGPAFRSQSRR